MKIRLNSLIYLRFDRFNFSTNFKNFVCCGTLFSKALSASGALGAWLAQMDIVKNRPRPTVASYRCKIFFVALVGMKAFSVAIIGCFQS
jgi:hypothetical protein